jgi:hypothetical protein
MIAIAHSFPKANHSFSKLGLLGYNLILASTTYTMRNARIFDTIQEGTTLEGDSKDLFCGIAQQT